MKGNSFSENKDISTQFYKVFKQKRNFLVQHIRNNLEPTEKYLIAQKIFDRFFFIYFLCHKGIIKFENGGKISGENLFSRILLKKGNFLKNLKKLFHLFNSIDKNILEIGEYKIVIPYLNNELFRSDVLEQDLDISLTNKQWEEIFEFLNSYHWIIEDVKATEEHEEKILTPEILGHVYERSVVEWEQKGFEKEAEESVKKISERKKKGVYYTPESITDYISKNTIIPYLLDKLGNEYSSFEELIESKNKEDMKKALKILGKIKILDPACGSGAFLIKASEILFGLKRRLYYKIGVKKNFYDMKLDIITENIYGVDILQGAIEIAKLRLWLWLISDFEESKNEIKALPNIEYNLKVGNSLIGWLDEKLKQMPINTPLTEKVDGIFTGLIAFSENGDAEDLKKARKMLKGYKLDDYIEAYYILYNIYRRTHGLKAENLRSILETIRESIYSAVTPSFLNYVNHKIKPKHNPKKPPITKEEFDKLPVFHWRIDFGHIIKQGGFDVVIGNPPYITYKGKQKMKINPNETTILNYFYENSAEYKINSYALFVERGLSIINLNGELSYIIPSTILQNEYLKKIRKYIITKHYLKEIVNFGNKVFEAVTDSIILFVKNNNTKDNITIVKRKYNLNFSSNDKFIEWNQNEWNKEPDYIINLKINKAENIILKKIDNNSKILDDFLNVYVGIVANGIKKFLSDKKANSNYKKYLQGKHIQRYELNPVNLYINFNIQKLHSNTDERVYLQKEKILVRKTGNKLIASYDDNQYFTDQSIYNLYSKTDNTKNLKYLLSLLNSKLMNYYFNKKMITNADVYPYIKGIHLKKLPIKDISKEEQKPFIKIVDQILSITKSKDYLENKQKQAKVKELQDKIDKLVYKLYGLTEEEIKIVEGSK
ncbi:MAG: Eco57I restriction-modification methylase domain-containing protein [Candidatus Nanoarchaeia archaeon]